MARYYSVKGGKQCRDGEKGMDSGNTCREIRVCYLSSLNMACVIREEGDAENIRRFFKQYL